VDETLPEIIVSAGGKQPFGVMIAPEIGGFAIIIAFNG